MVRPHVLIVWSTARLGSEDWGQRAGLGLGHSLGGWGLASHDQTNKRSLTILLSPTISRVTVSAKPLGLFSMILMGYGASGNAHILITLLG